MYITKDILLHIKAFELFNLFKESGYTGLDSKIINDATEDLSNFIARDAVEILFFLVNNLLIWKYFNREFRDNPTLFFQKKDEIKFRRLDILHILNIIPTLEEKMNTELENIYARFFEASIETEFCKDIYPKICPFTIEQVLDVNFYPENE